MLHAVTVDHTGEMTSPLTSMIAVLTGAVPLSGSVLLPVMKSVGHATVKAAATVESWLRM